MNMRNLLALALVLLANFASAASERGVRRTPKVDTESTQAPQLMVNCFEYAEDYIPTAPVRTTTIDNIVITSGNWSEPPSSPPAMNTQLSLNSGDRIIIEGPVTFIENSTNFEDYSSDERFTLDIEKDSSWSYEVALAYASQYLVDSGFIAGNRGEGIFSLGFVAAFGDWFFGWWLGQSEDDPGLDESYANEFDVFAGWAHAFGEHFELEASLSYYDLAVPRMFSGTAGDLVVIELEASWPYEHITPYVAYSRYFEIAGDVGDGNVFQAGVRGHWGGDEAWWDIDLSAGHNDGVVLETSYIWGEIGPGFKLGENTQFRPATLQFIWGDGDDHLAFVVSVTHEF